MKKVSKLLSLFLAGSLIFGGMLLGCSSGDDDGNGGTQQGGGGQQGGGDITPTTPTTPDAVDAPSSTITDPVMNGALFPANGETAAYADTRLLIKFDSAPTIAADAKVVIKEGSTVVDTINAKNEKLYSLSMSGALKELNVRDQLMVLEGNTLVVTAHNDSDGKYLIQPSKTYSVTVSGVTGKVGGADFDGSAAWSFTTKAAPTISEEITVGHTGTEQFYSIQGALDAIKAAGSEKHTIKLSAGNYHERNFYNGSANVTIEGPAKNNHGEGTVIYWMNNNQWNDGTRDRVNFLWQGKDLTLKNVILKSSFTRKAYGSQNADATDGRNEVLNFDSKSNLVCYNSTFIGTQDTLILGANGGRGWFYDSVVQGDVDYIWGTLDVCLFENCQLICQGGDTNASYIFAARSPTTNNVTGKGFVIYNSNITIDGIKAYFGRDMGSESQSAILFSSVKTLNNGTLDPTLYLKASSKYVEDINGEVAVGFMDYGNKLNGEALDVSKRLAKTATMSARLVNREYNGRTTILNRGYNELTQKYVDLAKWDISAYETEFNAPEDKSGSNFYVEPVYKKNFVSGGTLQLTGASGATFASSNTEIATVDANGLVTTVAGTSGNVTITAEKDGRKDISVLNVIAENIPATAVAISVADASVATYGVTTATITFEPAEASEKTVTLTSSDDNVLFVTDDGKLVKTYETAKDTVKVWVAGASATLTAKSKSYEEATAGTCTVASNANEKIWTCAAAPLRMNTDIQSGTAGLWDGLVVDSKTNSVISTAGKMSFKLADKMQTRNVTIFIPVDGASVIEFATNAAIVAKHTIGTNDGSSVAQDFAAVEGKQYTYSYTYNGGKKGVVSGDNAAIPTTFAKTAGATTVSADQKYLRMNVIGSDEYFTYIKVTKTGDFNAEWNGPAAPELNVADFADATVTLDLSSNTKSATKTTTATCSDTTKDITVTYSSGNQTVATVDSSTGEVTAKSIGSAVIKAKATADGCEDAEKTYEVIVKKTVAEESETFDFRQNAFKSGVDYGVITATGNYHGTTYGLNGTISVTFKVAGPSTIYIPTMDYEFKGTLKNGENTLGEFDTKGTKNTATTLEAAKTAGTVKSVKYTESEAATLTLSGSGYLPLIWVEPSAAN